MQSQFLGTLVAAGMLLSAAAFAQVPVVGAKDADALFHSPDPKLDANKQIAYHIYKDILEGGDVNAIDKYLSTRYIQHNPNMTSGHDGLKKMLSQVKAKAGVDKLAAHVVAVVADGDYVVVSAVQLLPDPKKPGQMYTTTHFDMWRMKDGKADEHWDEAALGPPPGPPPSGR